MAPDCQSPMALGEVVGEAGGLATGQRRQAGVDAEAVVDDLGQVEVDESGERADDG